MTRPFTVIEPTLLPNAESVETEGRFIHLMIKLYADGLLTQQIAQLKQGKGLSYFIL